MAETTAAFVKAMAVDELPPGTSRVVTIDGRRIALFNVAGTLYAIDDTCTHEEASLGTGAVHGEVVACPKHGSRFHIPTGRVLSLPAVVPVNTYQVKVEAGQVWVLPVPHRGRGMPHKA